MKKVLFIGNSATYVNEIPQTLARLSTQAGYPLECAQITRGGFELTRHADVSTPHGQRILEELNRGYDTVFLQDNGNCVTTKEKREACADACGRLVAAVRKSGAAPAFYVRPPYGTMLGEYSPFVQCREFDLLFGTIAKELGGLSCVYANRAFAHAMKSTPYPLWGPDNAHTSPYGGYLIVCTFFATLFGVSSSCLEAEGIESAAARELQAVADAVALQGVIPWEAPLSLGEIPKND